MKSVLLPIAFLLTSCASSTLPATTVTTLACVSAETALAAQEGTTERDLGILNRVCDAILDAIASLKAAVPE